MPKDVGRLNKAICTDTFSWCVKQNLGFTERNQLENMYRVSNTSFNILLGLFQHYGLSQTRGMLATVSGPMPTLVIKQRTLQEHILSPCFAICQTEVFKLKS